MAKGILRRVLAILLAVSLAAAYLPAGEARAATALTTNVPGLTASYENGTWSANGTALSGSATGSAGGGCESASATTSTLTLKNGKGTEAILAFDYDKPVLGSGGSVTIAGTAVTAAGTFTKTLSADEAVTVVIVSGNAGAYTSSVDLKNVTLVSNVTVTTTFAPPTEGGSYTVDGTAVTEQTSYTQPAAHAYALAAAPAAGFKFLGWYSVGEDKYLSASAVWNAMFDAEKTIRAEFVSADTPVFETNGKWFTDLRDAVSYAASAVASKITLIADGTLPAGEYTVPAGISLLIPYDSAHTLKTTVPDLFKAVGPTAPWKYKTLTMASGASLTVKGRLNVGGKVNSTNNAYTGVTSGPYGFIDMKEGSSITVEQDAYLYCWGYISGAGTVHVLSGGTVYEPFQICDIRGGTATNSMNGNDQKVFPVSQYYVQNIEAGMTLEYGAKEIATGSATVQGMTENPQVSFIGTSGSMFNLSSGGRFVKTYDPKADRVTYDIFGDASLDSIKMNVGISVNSADYVLPIMENTSIRIRSGNTVINQDLCLIPGFEAEIGQGATFAIASGKNLYVYDRDEWQLGKFIYPDTTFKTSYYSPSRANADKFTDAKMVDVKLDVNGTVQAAGGFYTTAGGADITSSAGTGKVIMSKVPSDGTTYQATQSGTTISYTSIPVTSAKLHNGSAYAGTDEEYTLTAGAEAGKTFFYSKAQDRWTDQEEETYTITWKDADGTVLKTEQLAAGVMPTPPEDPVKEADAQFTYTFAGWTPEVAAVSADATYTATYTSAVREYTILWLDYDGTTLRTDQTAYGEMPEYGDTTALYREGDAQYMYTFAGWTPEIVPVTGDASYQAVYEETIRLYEIRFVNDDGSVLRTKEVPYGETPVYDGETPVKEADAQYTYVFTGWTPEIAAVTGPATYTAVYRPELRTYTVTWVNWDDTVLETDRNVPYGETPVYGGEIPQRAADEEFTYTFAGWTPALHQVDADIVYKAVFTSTANEYTVTWLDWDGSVLELEEHVIYGTEVKYPGETPMREADAQYTYTFAGWQPEITEGMTVTGNLTFQAQYTSVLRTYTVTWVNWDDTVLETDEEIPYGETPVYNGETPQRAADEEFTYTFAGWTPELHQADADIVYKAVFISTVNEYTVTWLDWDGSVLALEEHVAYGTKVKYPGETPERESDAQYTYTFAGWQPEITEEMTVTGNLTFNAQYTKALRTYTVTWVNWDDTVLETDEGVPYGEAPVYDGEIPQRAEDVQFTYTFAGWTPALHEVDADIVYKAVFTSTAKEYTVTWLDWDGSVLELEEHVIYGTEVKYPGETPERESDAQYTYTFAGWQPEIAEGMTVTGNLTFQAQYTKALQTHTVTWVNWDDTVLETDEGVPYGETPVYDGEAPQRAADERYRYEFTGWEPAVHSVDADITYRAAFAEVLQTYTVTWVNWDGTVLETDRNVPYGETPVYDGETPQRAADEEFTYVFAGWTPEITAVTGDASYQAVYEETIRSYEIRFVNDDGSVLRTKEFPYGETPVYDGETPVKEADAQYTYVFTGWLPEIVPVTGPATYTAVYRPELRTYTVTWVNWDDTVLETDEGVPYGETPVYDGETPQRAADEEFTYTFAGWTPEIAAVTGPATYTAVYTEEPLPPGEVFRIFGNNRYVTSRKIAGLLKEELDVEKFDAVILATGEAFADALSASYLSAVKQAPILLINEAQAGKVCAYIKENVAEGGTVYITGGVKAVPDEWIAELSGYECRRLAGGTRYVTNLAILREAGITAGQEILVATGNEYADSLSAAATGRPMLLVNGAELTKGQKAFLDEIRDQGCSYVVIGGVKAVSEELQSALEAYTGVSSERVYGNTRYATSVELAKRYFPDAQSMVLTVGNNYPDGLCAGLLGAVRKAPLVLCLEGKSKNASGFAAERGIHSGIVLGGAKLISDDLVRTILDLADDVEIIEK